jgi:sterol desaturase/sphingolipid hydroxylase (fatty acid hydroxylase superfamily)
MTNAESEAGLWLQPLWNYCLKHVGVETLGHPLFFIIAVITTVVVAGLGFSVVDVFITRKLQLKASASYLLITLPGYLAVFAILQWLPTRYRFAVPARAPSGVEFVRDLAICLIVGDLLSYWWHRLEHASKFIWKNVHHVHHKVACPLSVWSGFYVHPIESLCVFITFYIYPFLFRVHPLVFVTYAAINTFVTMVTHCGYDLPLYPKSIFASTPMHEHHHGSGRPSNFSVLLNMSDRIFGTFKPFQVKDSHPSSHGPE